MFQSKLIRVMFYSFAIFGVLELAALIFLLFYLPPESGLKTEFAFFFYIFIPHSLVFLAVGFIGLILHKRSENKKVLLRKQGVRINAVISQVKIDNSVTVNMRNPYRIICREKHGQKRTFTSERILGIMDYSIIGQPITVFVSKTNPKEYLVDITDYL